MSGKIKQYALRCHTDVQVAVDELVSYERDGISANHVICEAILFYAKHKRDGSKVVAKPITPVADKPAPKWTKKTEVEPKPYYVSDDPDDDSDPIDYEPT